MSGVSWPELITMLGLLATWLGIGLKMRSNRNHNPGRELHDEIIRLRDALGRINGRLDELGQKVAVLWDHHQRQHGPAP